MSEDETAQRAIVDEALKKGALVWLEIGDRAGAGGDHTRGHARWYAWTDGHVYLLTGEDEQPDPGLPRAGAVRVVVRSKDNRHRLIAFDADVSVLAATDEDWDAATAALVKARLNLFEAEDAGRRWAQPGFALFRLTPRTPLVESPDDTPDESHRETPAPTPATTSARRPWVLHRRGGSGRRLS